MAGNNESLWNIPVICVYHLHSIVNEVRNVLSYFLLGSFFLFILQIYPKSVCTSTALLENDRVFLFTI